MLLTLRFHGAHFHGSAVQKNAVTVQGTVQPALERIAGESLALKCCSRTDAGVSAEMFCISFKTHNPIPCGRLVAALNAALPDAAAAYACRTVPPDFHARYACTGKRYVYRIHNARVRDVFQRGLCLQAPRPLDAALLHTAAQAFVGTHDFSAFCAAGGSVEDKVRTIRTASVRREGEWVLFDVTGDGFLYNMVRIMVGTLLDVGYGRIAPERVGDILRARDRAEAGATAPPQGLCLKEVYYGDLSPLGDAGDPM